MLQSVFYIPWQTDRQFALFGSLFSQCLQRVCIIFRSVKTGSGDARLRPSLDEKSEQFQSLSIFQLYILMNNVKRHISHIHLRLLRRDKRPTCLNSHLNTITHTQSCQGNFIFTFNSVSFWINIILLKNYETDNFGAKF